MLEIQVGVGLEVTLEGFEKMIGAVLTDDAQLDAVADSGAPTCLSLAVVRSFRRGGDFQGERYRLVPLVGSGRPDRDASVPQQLVGDWWRGVRHAAPESHPGAEVSHVGTCQHRARGD